MTSTSVAGRVATARPWAATVVRLGLAAVWCYAGASKVGDPAASLRAVRAYDLLPEWLAKAVGYGLPFVEITLAAFLLAGLVTRFAAAVSAFLLVVFTAGIISAAARGLSIDCGCFGGGGTVESGQTSYLLEVLRDAGLFVLSVALVVWPASRFSGDEAIERGGVRTSPVRVGPKSTKEAQRRLRELEARRRREFRQRMRLFSAGGAVVLVLAGVIGVGVQADRAGPTGPIAHPSIAVGPDGRDGLRFGPADAKVTVDVYEDFQCPVCKQFHSDSGDLLKQVVTSGKVAVRYHTVSFLNRASSTRYSSRSAAAAACAADFRAFPAFQDTLFRAQPPEGGEGLSEGQLLELGRTSGAIESQFVDCVEEGKYDDWVEVVTDQASRNGVTGIPTVFVNGRRVEGAGGGVPSEQDLATAIQNAGA